MGERNEYARFTLSASAVACIKALRDRNMFAEIGVAVSDLLFDDVHDDDVKDITETEYPMFYSPVFPYADMLRAAQDGENSQLCKYDGEE